jgi:DNA repair exonuclease SbcCD ATPase subunit
LAIVGALAIWGCSQNPPHPPASVKTARLQEEIRNLTGAREQLRQDLRTAHADLDRLQEEIKKLREAAKERDDLRNTLAVRTAERDGNLAQLDQLRKGIKALMDQSETAGLGHAQPVSAAEVKPAKQS